MKLIVAIIQAYDTDKLLRTVTGAGFRVTRFSSRGSFLRSTNSTILIGVEDERVGECLALIRDGCRSRVETVPPDMEAHWVEVIGADLTSVSVGGAIVFLLPVERFVRL